jgi:hypothetical protein
MKILQHTESFMLIAQRIAVWLLHKVFPAAFHILRSAFLPDL